MPSALSMEPLHTLVSHPLPSFLTSSGEKRARARKDRRMELISKQEYPRRSDDDFILYALAGL